MATSNQVQLLQLLVRTILPGASAQAPALVDKAVETLSVSASTAGAPATADGISQQIEALLAHLPDRAARFHALRRRLALAGSPGSGMAAYRDKAQLMQVLQALHGVAGAPPVASLFTDAASGSLTISAAPRPPPPAAAADALAAAGALLPPWVELALIRDLVFVLQGIDGAHVRLDADADAYIANDVVDGFTLPVGVRSCVAFLGELGWAHRRARHFLGEVRGR